MSLEQVALSPFCEGKKKQQSPGPQACKAIKLDDCARFASVFAHYTRSCGLGRHVLAMPWERGKPRVRELGMDCTGWAGKKGMTV